MPMLFPTFGAGAISAPSDGDADFASVVLLYDNTDKAVAGDSDFASVVLLLDFSKDPG